MSSFSTPPTSAKKSRTRQRNRTPSSTAKGSKLDTPQTNGKRRGSNGTGKGRNNNNNNSPHTPHNNNRSVYETYVDPAAYSTANPGKTIVYGKFRGLTTSRKSGYVSPSKPPPNLFQCKYKEDATTLKRDVFISDLKARNRVVDGEYCYVVVDDVDTNDPSDDEDGADLAVENLAMEMEASTINAAEAPKRQTWNSQEKQQTLWSPQHETNVPLPMKPLSKQEKKNLSQLTGRVIYAFPAEKPKTIVGVLKSNPNGRGGVLLNPISNKLTSFVVPASITQTDVLASGTYTPGTWGTRDYFPKLSDVSVIGNCIDIEAETIAALRGEGIDWDETFEKSVEADVLNSVEAGRNAGGWEPTEEDMVNRRDFRSDCVFTIDPTTARDLDDALCIEELPDKTGVLVSVHIADVTNFVKPGSNVDEEARNRCTTVYMVDRVIPMLPRDLCEIACSLNEGVTRLSFSCQFEMDYNGGLKTDAKGKRKVWYGRGVIRSKCRLDYRTAQNIISGKCGNGNQKEDDEFWDLPRQPVDGVSRETIAEKVRLMHRIAMGRRAMRFEHGAVTLNKVKLAFKMNKNDGEKIPEKAEAYPIYDSNRVVEEFMLLANYLVAEKLIMKGKGAGLLRRHEQPSQKGLTEAKEMAEACGVYLDISTSQSLQETLNEFTKRASATNSPDDVLKLQAITALLSQPFQPAEYFIASEFDQDDYIHFALNIPYYTHFTSPIRRYADCIVHRVLQAALDDDMDAYNSTYPKTSEVAVAERCNEMKQAAKKAQERSDRVFLSIFLKHNPIQSTMGVVIGMGEKSFTVLIPEIGAEGRVYLDDMKKRFHHKFVEKGEDGKKTIKISPTEEHRVEKQLTWQNLDVQLFKKIEVSVTCKEDPPVDIKIWLCGPHL
ncbi:hypothetical protein TrST_g12441 [Triparma strigata]|uniref:RNB domain-containing protein n=1 Tax=Triparma strigata TaxID=1606541 RepID=A0A9W7F3W0_9STRA|nr:hypothetical protein TrST_g12441 [Triparma strigata]